MRAPEYWRPLSRHPLASGLFIDFDGTLSAIVDDPPAALPLEGAVEVLEELAEKLGRVAVLSGRPLEFLDGQFGPSVDLIALYGLEARLAGRRAFRGAPLLRRREPEAGGLGGRDRRDAGAPAVRGREAASAVELLVG